MTKFYHGNPQAHYNLPKKRELLLFWFRVVLESPLFFKSAAVEDENQVNELAQTLRKVQPLLFLISFFLSCDT
jgi:hypothetical protein